MWVDIGSGRLLVLTFPRSGDLPTAMNQVVQDLAETAVGNI